MRGSRQIIAITSEVQALVRSLERTFQRRTISVRPDSERIDAQTLALAAEFDVGKQYGRYGETIIRRVVSWEGGPSWFDPRENLGQYGITLRSGLRIFLEVEIDDGSRSAPSTFDREIRTLAVRRPAQVSLFSDVDSS